MSFDSKTTTITIEKDGDFLADSGSFFLNVLKDLGSVPDAPEGLARDWKMVEAWLQCEGRELTQSDYETFGVTFRSYLARGVAPSRELESPFKKFSQMAKAEGWQIVPVPPELVPIFKRMMASDQQIQRKRADDALQFAAAMKAVSTPQSRPTQHVPAPEQRSSKVQLNWMPLVASIVMLTMASADEWPRGFYQLLRFVVCGTAAYAVSQTLNHRQYWPWIMGGIAILFNPVLPISFTRNEWQPIDFGVAVIFAIALIQMRARRSRG